jgi:hypothetical protein
MTNSIPNAADLGDRPLVMSHVAIVFMTLVWTALIMRVYVRTVLIHSFGWDDWTMILAAVRTPAKNGAQKPKDTY